jgi:hypothetical protein
MKMQSANSRATFMVPDASRLLKRFYFLQREGVLAQAGWMPGTLHWETKLLWPEFLWQDSLIAAEFRERVLELRYPERRLETDDEAELIGRWRELLRNAPSDLAFAIAMRDGFKPFLRQVYSRYLDSADQIDDAPTVRILRQAIEDIDEQSARLAGLRHGWVEVYQRAEIHGAEQWSAKIKETLDAIGAEAFVRQESPEFHSVSSGQLGGKPFAISRLGRRDPRFSYSRIPWPDSLDPSRGAGAGFELQVRQAQAHLNEVWAAEMASAVIFDLAEEGPAEFLKDAARWCFDEIRHCRMGYARFLEWGFTKAEMPMGSFSYDIGAKVDAVTRLGIIFYFETSFIHTKSERTKSFAEFGDRTSSHDMDFDWADELIHTYYGKKWLEYFLEKRGLGAKPHDIKKRAEDAVKQCRAEATEEERQRVYELYQSTMERARSLARAPNAD